MKGGAIQHFETHAVLARVVHYIVSRLGSGEGDANEVMAAPFFSGIAWNLLEKKRLTPPFKPQVSNYLQRRNYARTSY